MPTSAEKRLQELLDIKDAELETAQSSIDALERQIEFGVAWMRHRTLSDDRPRRLPCPRVELSFSGEDELRYLESEVALIVPERDGTCTAVPIGYTKTTGRGIDFDLFPTSGELTSERISDLPSGPLSDAFFLAERLGMPAFVVIEAERTYRIIAMRPQPTLHVA